MKKLLFILYITTSFISQTSVASINSLGRGEGLENSIKAGITAATSEDALKGAFTSIFTAGAITNSATILLAWIINSWAWTSISLGANLYHRGLYHPNTYGGFMNLNNW